MTVEYAIFTHQDLMQHLADFTEILCDVVNGGASVNFIAPFLPADAEQYWLGVAEKVQQKQSILLAALEDQTVVGTIQVALALQPNGPHRAEIQKMLVHSSKRRRGIATKLMQAAEEAALAQGRWLLFLDTERENGAAGFYEKMGYSRVGIIEQFALDYTGENFIDTVIFSKSLR